MQQQFFKKPINMKKTAPDIFFPLKIAALSLRVMLIVLALLERLGIRLPSFKEDYDLPKEKLAKMRTSPVYVKIITEQFGVHLSEVKNYLRKQ